MPTASLLTLGPATAERDSHGEIKYLCNCACGGTKLLTRRAFRKGKTKSCGCLAAKYSAKGPANPLYKNGRAQEEVVPERGIWRKMHDRCSNPNNSKYMRYGGRGIYVDARWATYEQFIADMGPRPSTKHSIERRNNDGPYAKDNCYWATPIEQANNRLPPAYWIVRGRKLTVTDIAAVLSRNPDSLQKYLESATAAGQTVEQALRPLVK